MLHHAFTAYFDNRLTPAPVEDVTLKRIVDLGSGIGTWAIDAARRWPEAQVVAVDISPVPVQKLPGNLCFVQADLGELSTWGEEKFDLVHARLVLMHLKNPQGLICTMAELIKPGGWIVLADPDDSEMKDKGLQAMCTISARMFEIMRANRINPCIGGKLEEIIRSTGLFDEIIVHRIFLQLKDTGSSLACAWKETVLRIGRQLPILYADQGITQDMYEEQVRRFDDPQQELCSVVYFVCARRGQD